MYACVQPEPPKTMLNQIQVLGSHNSYKLKMDPALWQAVYIEDSIRALQLDYGHVSLTQQLETGLRSLEIDVFHDPKGGKFKYPAGLKLVQALGAQAADFDTSIMEDPGLKVLHIHDIDFRSNCGTFKLCLNEIKAWSEAHPDHVPIIITINSKDEFIDRPGFEKPFTFTSGALDTLDEEILAVFSPKALIRPDDIRGDFPSLEKAVRSKGWGTLDDTRGKILFVLDQNDVIMERYIAGHPSLKERVLFVNAPVGTPEAAFLILNDPVEDFDLIRQRVKEGYLVRTRADAGTWEARRNDLSRYQKALSSHAHVISTDYYLPDVSLGTDYQIQLPEGKTHLIRE